MAERREMIRIQNSPKKEAPGAENAKVDEAAANANTIKGSKRKKQRRKTLSQLKARRLRRRKREEEALKEKT